MIRRGIRVLHLWAFTALYVGVQITHKLSSEATRYEAAHEVIDSLSWAEGIFVQHHTVSRSFCITSRLRRDKSRAKAKCREKQAHIPKTPLESHHGFEDLGITGSPPALILGPT